MHSTHESASGTKLAAMTLSALGVVYGDIGTSPLYALKEVFHAGHVPVTPDNILGVLSLIFWTMTTVVSFKYVLLILRADNNGEGGLIAMLALATHAVRDKPRLYAVLMSLGIFGTAIFYGDGVITPAISVLSARSRASEVAAPSLHGLGHPAHAGGDHWACSRCNGWAPAASARPSDRSRWCGSCVLVALGLPHILDAPGRCWSRSIRCMRWVSGIEHKPPWASWRWAPSCWCVTGGEALYADLGHFGKRAHPHCLVHAWPCRRWW